MSSLDSDITNGTCYYAYNKAAGSELVPCGNAGIANVPCCFSGDYCDSENTCFNNATGNTYLAGCTDSQYTDSSCPWKSEQFEDQEWVGLIRCDAVNKTADEWAWAGCSVPSDSYTTLERLGSCDCTSKATLFIGEQALTRHASLPSSVGGTISWVEGYAVTAADTTSTSSASQTVATGSGETGSTASATATMASASSGSGSNSGGSSISVGAKAGIAVGAIGGVLSIIAIAVAIFLHRRRKRGGRDGKGEPTSAPASASAPPPEKSPAAPLLMSHGNESAAPPAYSGYKAELPADDYTTNMLGVTPSIRTPGSQHSELEVTPEMTQSEFGGERRLSLVSELSSSDDGPRGVPRRMTAIAELQG